MKMFLVFALLVLVSRTQAQDTDYKIQDYQFGSQWSRSLIQSTDFKNPVISKAVNSSVSVNGASGIYLGKFNGQHIIATANHVITYPGCDFVSMGGFQFENGFSSRFSNCLATFEELDLALLSFAVEDPQIEKNLEAAAVNFAFDEIPQQGDALLLVGHGLAGNPEQLLMLGRDEDCRVVSKTGDVRLIDDPDQINPNGYASWQIANTCDVSHGDSGAALFSIKSGKPVALVSSGTFPVQKRFQASHNVKSELQSNPDVAWQMSLAVPSFKMREVIARQIKSGQYDVTTTKTLTAIIHNKAD